MTSPSPNPAQQQFLHQGLDELLNHRHPLYQLALNIPWHQFEKAFVGLYSSTGRPAKPIRRMVTLLILKQMYNLSDDEALAEWSENPYWQFVSGEIVFQWNAPCDSSDMTYVRKRLGEKGIAKIFQVSIQMHGNAAHEADVVIDTTVQPKNITYPTDVKLYKKVIEWCQRIAKKEGIVLRQTYTRVVKKLSWSMRLRNHPKRRKEALKAERHMKTIAGRMVRDVERKLDGAQTKACATTLKRCHRVLTQKRHDTNKIYSLHEPQVYCISKGKAHRKYEFGAKAVVVKTKKKNIIVGVLHCPTNDYDGHTLDPVLQQVETMTGHRPSRAFVDEGFKGKKKVGTTEIIRPHVHIQQKTGAAQRRKHRKWLGHRASIEPCIGHLKSDYR